MIDFQNQQLRVQGHIWEPITAWAVWFVTPGGLCVSPEEANKFCEEHGFPRESVVPVAVATGPTTYEVHVRP